MIAPSESGEHGGLRDYINNLIRLQATPAIRDGRDSSQIVNTLLALLVNLLSLDFAYARVTDGITGQVAEFVCLSQVRNPPLQAQKIGRALDQSLINKSATLAQTIPDPAGEGEVRIAPLNLGLRDEPGMLVAGSKRKGFPTPKEVLILRLGTDQALIGLQEVRRLNDITQHKRAAEALRASEERFRQYFELGLIGMAITTPTKGILEVNDELCRILGYDRKELLQKTWTELTYPEDVAADVASFNRVLAGEFDGYSLDKRWIRKDGRVIDSIMAAKCLRRADGSVNYFVGLVLETTARKRIEGELRRSEAYLAEAQRISHTGSWGWSVASGKVVWSMETFRIFGINPSEKEPSYTMVMQRVHPSDRERVEKEVQCAASENRSFKIEFRINLYDGATRHLEAMGHPVQNDEGNSGEFIGAIMDVTERKLAEEAMNKLQMELARVSRITSLAEMAASIAHEINQPLGAIVNNSNTCLRLLTNKPSGGDSLRKALKDIVNDANRAGAIIARIRALFTRSTPNRTLLELKSLVADVLVLAQHELTEHRITLRTELDQDLPRVFGDRVELQQVLLNLVKNACESMNAMPDERRLLVISSQGSELDGRPAVSITLRDLGHGFNPKDTERLFDAFYTSKVHGIGMGLRISRSIVEAHGGRLWAAANENAGATFTCVLPAAI